MIVGLHACRTSDWVDKVNGYTCDCDEDHELMLQVSGSACVARHVKNFLLQRVQIVGVRCDTVLAESAEIHRHVHSTEECVFVAACSITVARAHMYTAQCNAAAEQQPEGWRIVDPPPCLGGSTHRWVPVDTHNTPVPERDGCGWPM